MVNDDAPAVGMLDVVVVLAVVTRPRNSLRSGARNTSASATPAAAATARGQAGSRGARVLPAGAIALVL